MSAFSNPSEAANGLRWQQQTGFYEVWFFKCHINEGEQALWGRYVLKSPGQLEVWAVWFEQGQTPVVWIESFPLDYLRVSDKFFFIQMGKSWLKHNSAYGRLPHITWELDYEPSTTAVHLVPAWLAAAPLPRTKACTPHPDLIGYGRIQVNGQTYQVSEAPLMQGHLWGVRHADNWLWGHCNAFAEDPSAVIEVLSARLQIGPLKMPRLTSIYLHFGQHTFLLNQPHQLVSSRMTLEPDGWSFVAHSQDLRFMGRFSTDLGHVANVTYYNPDGSVCPCRNSALGHVHVVIEQRQAGRWSQIAELTSFQMAAIEWGGQ